MLRSSERTCERRSSTTSGLARKPAAPASRQARRAAGSSRPVSMSTGQARVLGVHGREHLEPGAARQGQVEHHRVEGLGERQEDGDLAVLRDDDLVPVEAQSLGQEVRDARLVLDDEDPGGRHRPARRCRTGGRRGRGGSPCRGRVSMRALPSFLRR